MYKTPIAMWRKTLLICTALFVFCAVHAQEKVSYPELGFEFGIPPGWTGQESAGYYVMGHHTIAGLLILTSNEAKSQEELIAQANGGIVDEGVNLQPTGDFVAKGANRVVGHYEGYFDGAQVRCYAVGLINTSGFGVTVMVVTTKELFSATHESEADKLATSVNFFVPKESTQTAQWKNKIIGRQLKYMRTSSSSDYSGGYTGSSDVTVIKLYADGSFYYYSNSHISISAGDGAGGESGWANGHSRDSNEGSYSIYSVGNTSYLELTFNDERVFQYVLSTNDQGHTLLDGSRYFVVGLDE